MKETLAVIPGSVPNLINLPQGCKFAPRCPYVKEEICTSKTPDLREIASGHRARCYMRFPETAHHWAGVAKADWHFQGDEVLIDESSAQPPLEPPSTPYKEAGGLFRNPGRK